MSGFAGSGEGALVSLLNLVGDPAAYKKRLDDLNAAVQAAETANGKLEASKSNIKTDRATLVQDQQVHAANVAAFAVEKEAILAKAANFDAQADDLAAREKEVAAAEASHASAKADFDKLTVVKVAELSARETAVVNRESHLDLAQAEVETMRVRLAAKLAKLKELSQ